MSRTGSTSPPDDPVNRTRGRGPGVFSPQSQATPAVPCCDHGLVLSNADSRCHGGPSGSRRHGLGLETFSESHKTDCTMSRNASSWRAHGPARCATELLRRVRSPRNGLGFERWHYKASGNINSKVLDFVQFGGARTSCFEQEFHPFTLLRRWHTNVQNCWRLPACTSQCRPSAHRAISGSASAGRHSTSWPIRS